jgi:hypothetical protein
MEHQPSRREFIQLGVGAVWLAVSDIPLPILDNIMLVKKQNNIKR